MSFTINDLKKHLGPGLGLRKNKYLIEIPVPGIEGESLNVLCRSAGLPERTITTTTAWHKGRKYNLRGETDYGGTYEISIVDDSNMGIRKVFDKWLKKVDNSKPINAGILGASYESELNEISAGLEVATNIKTSLEHDNGLGFLMGFLDKSNANSPAAYQTDINIWQLDGTNHKVYGYKLQNAFPSSIGIVTLDDGDENTLSEFSLTFTFSEFTPLEDQSAIEQIGGALLGDSTNDILSSTENLFD